MIWSIQALRALSVLLVILYHTKTPFFENGFLGVDVFFIISGFIITKGLIDKPLTVINFLKKRALRLLPSLYMVLASVITISVFFDPPHITKNLSEAIVSSVLYFTNLFYYLEIDYFNDFHNSSPLLHLWSLSVEEQFYFLLPIVFLVLKPNKKSTIFALSSLALFSFIYWIILNQTDKLAAFYFPHTRFWELLIGVMIALVPKNKLQIPSFVSLLIFLLIFLSVIFFQLRIASFLVMFFTCLLLYFNNCESKYFKNTLSRLGGKLSYNIYLWHQPVIYYFKEFQNNNNLIVILLITIFLSYITNKFIEEPVRKSKSKYRIYGVVLVSILLIILNYQIIKKSGLGEFKNDYWNSKLNIENRDSVFQQKELYWNKVLNNKNIDSSILIIGDSKGEDLVVSIQSISNTTYNFFKLQTYDYNKSLKELELNTSLKYSKLKLVVFTNTWKYLNNKKCSELINSIANENPKIPIIVLSTCNFEDVSSLAFLISRKQLNQHESEKLFFKSLRDDWKRQSDDLKSQLKQKSNLFWFNKENAFCSGSNCKLISADGKLYIYDTGHVTPLGAKTLGSWFLKSIKEECKLDILENELN